MSFYKVIFGSIVSFTFAANAMAIAVDPKIVLDSTIQVMRYCYEVQHQTGSQLSHCIVDMVHDIPNPDNYNVHIEGDLPGEATLIIYNHTGYQIRCNVSAEKTIHVKRCTNYQASPLTHGQDISITPPDR
ncbi:hypothetical protein [Legionella cardiaca]|uniref:Uncharacterized protein n=1 Tax=Legionella cardiaca TaxID=1071983 RepID=A0ABY8AWN5_9GAMM|nr:hypothetical protein [Legionella cardiaca]WED44591.1 hypothetical protein PXX05_07325 [Legionella cardiaca]